MKKKFRVGVEANIPGGEIPVAAAASEPLMSNHAAATKMNYEKKNTR